MDYENELKEAFETIRRIRNNLAYDEFEPMVRKLTYNDANVRFPLLYAAQIARDSAYNHIHKSGGLNGS